MHEYSIVQALMVRLLREAQGASATEVRRLELAIGELSGVEADPLTSTPVLVGRGQPLTRRAGLEVDPVPARWSCSGCGRGFFLGEIPTCVDCGQPARLVAGDEIDLGLVEVEVP